MVSSHLVEALSSPTDALLELYKTQGRGGQSSSIDFPTVVTKHFSDVFKSDDAFREIPPLDVQHSPESHHDRSLVRFRAMVQDTSPSPEMYLSKSTSGKCGGWGIAQTEGDDEVQIDYSNLRDCSIVWAVSVPGESQWVRDSVDGSIRTKTEDTILHVPQRPHKYPPIQESHIGVQIKIYENLGNNPPKMNDVLDFVGILTHEPLHAETDVILHVPTLHVLFTRPQKLDVLPGPEFKTTSTEALQKELVSWISEEALGGDQDAAEWVLLASIARVQSRIRSLNPPSLTLSHFPPPSSPSLEPPTPTISHVLSLLLPTFVTLPLSLELLNTTPFVPESSEEDLSSGVLQLSSGTTLLITETNVREGQLVEKGVMNVMAIQDVMESQTLSYKFPFSQFSFPTDIQFIVLSEGKKSAFLKTDVTVPLRPSGSPNLYKPHDQVILPSSEKLASFRRLILDARFGKIEVGQQTSEHIQQDFVEERKSDKSISSDHLKLSITTARLLGLTLLEKELTIETWKRSKALEARRKARLD